MPAATGSRERADNINGRRNGYLGAVLGVETVNLD